MKITEDQFETFEEIILTDQMSAADVHAELSANPEFENWYRTRSLNRQNNCTTKSENDPNSAA